MFLLFAINMFVVVTGELNHTSKNVEGSLIRHLLHDRSHQPSLRPIANPNKPIYITFNINLIKLKELDERNQRVTLQLGYEVGWLNEMMNWNPREYQGIPLLKIPPNLLWTPDITLMNNDGDKNAAPHRGTDYITLIYNGWNMWGPKMTLTSFFNVNVKNFPFDIQNFTLRFRSWNLNEYKLKIQMPFEYKFDPITAAQLSQMFRFDVTNRSNTEMPIAGIDYISHSEWELLSTKRQIIPFHYRNFPIIYTEIKFTFVFARRPTFYIVTAIIPVVIMVAIILCSYFLPANSGERMGVLITVLLAFAVYLELINASLPRNSLTTPMLSIFYLVTMIECVLSFLGTCFVITLLGRGERNNSLPPQWVRKHILKHNTKRNLSNKTSRRYYPQIESAFTTDNESYIDINKDADFRWLSGSMKKRIIEGKASMSKVNIPDGQKEILSCLETIVDAINELKYTLNTKQQIDSEWKQLAEILDQTCCVMFILGFIILSLAILLPPSIARYNTHKMYHHV